MRTFTADRGDHRRRLDHVILRHLNDLRRVSRSLVQRWIDNGWVEVAGQRAGRAAQRVQAGDIVCLSVESLPTTSPLLAQDIPLAVLFEDAHLVAIDKPAGLIVHPSFAHADGTLMNALVHYAREWASGRPSLVHRLDKWTSGLLLVAKSPDAHAALTKALSSPGARKEYLALCYGRMAAPRRRLRFPLGPDPEDRRRMIVRVDGKDAITDVTRVARSRGVARGLTLVCCRLVTGRTHQIRAHLQASGLPVVGDPVYGDDGWRRLRDSALAGRLRAFPRQALHAWRLTFPHPVGGRSVVLKAPLPSDLTGLLDDAGLSEPMRPTGDHDSRGWVA